MIIGQRDILDRLDEELASGKVPHAIMFNGPEGCGALPIAISFAQKLLGDSPMAQKLQHPDLHFAFPIYKKYSAPKVTYCDDFIVNWRKQCLEQSYFGMAEWMSACGANNQQLMIYGQESDAITRKLSLKSSQGGYKVMIIWLPEKMNDTCANKLLKLLEEPPAQTVFILVTEKLEQVLQTIRSRTQIINLPALTTEDIETVLIEQYHADASKARRIARSSMGNMAAALRTINENSDSEDYFELFVSLMRLAYTRQVKEMKLWSEKVAEMGRERIKAFLAYCQNMIRENFIYNFHRHDELNYMNEKEANFAVKFAPFINEKNVIGIIEELELAQRDIAQNAQAKIVFFDFALKMIVLIKNR